MGTPVRVLHVINQFCGRAGAEVSLREFILGSTDREVEHGVVVLSHSDNDFDALIGTPTRLYVPASDSLTWPGRFKHVYAAVSEFEPDIVHTSLFDANVVGRLAAKLGGVPSITTLVSMPWQGHENVRSLRRRLKYATVRNLDRVLARHATTRFHAVADVVAEASSEAFSVAPDKCATVHRGRSADRLGRRSVRRQQARSALLDELGLPSHAQLVLTVAREEPQKNHLLVVRAADFLLRANSSAVFLFAGARGATSGEIDRELQRLSLFNKIRRLGVRADVPDLLAACDAFVMMSTHEGAAGAALEAMALEIPIIASSIPAMVEALDGGRCGTLVPLGDPEALAAAIDGALRGGGAVESKVRAARERFESTYELQAVTEAMIQLYRDTLARHALR